MRTARYSKSQPITRAPPWISLDLVKIPTNSVPSLREITAHTTKHLRDLPKRQWMKEEHEMDSTLASGVEGIPLNGDWVELYALDANLKLVQKICGGISWFPRALVAGRGCPSTYKFTPTVLQMEINFGAVFVLDNHPWKSNNQHLIQLGTVPSPSGILAGVARHRQRRILDGHPTRSFLQRR